MGFRRLRRAQWLQRSRLCSGRCWWAPFSFSCLVLCASWSCHWVPALGTLVLCWASQPGLPSWVRVAPLALCCLLVPSILDQTLLGSRVLRMGEPGWNRCRSSFQEWGRQDGAVLHVSPASPRSPSTGASLSSTEGSSSSLQRPKGSVWVWPDWLKHWGLRPARNHLWCSHTGGRLLSNPVVLNQGLFGKVRGIVWLGQWVSSCMSGCVLCRGYLTFDGQEPRVVKVVLPSENDLWEAWWDLSSLWIFSRAGITSSLSASF